jgi:hypothetical protein
MQKHIQTRTQNNPNPSGTEHAKKWRNILIFPGMTTDPMLIDLLILKKEVRCLTSVT